MSMNCLTLSGCMVARVRCMVAKGWVYWSWLNSRTLKWCSRSLDWEWVGCTKGEGYPPPSSGWFPWHWYAKAQVGISCETVGTGLPLWLFPNQWHDPHPLHVSQGKTGPGSHLSELFCVPSVYGRWLLMTHQHLLQGAVWPKAGAKFHKVRIWRIDLERCLMYGITIVAFSGSSDDLGWVLDVDHQFLFTWHEGYWLLFRASAVCFFSLSLSSTYVQILSAPVIKVLTTATLCTRGCWEIRMTQIVTSDSICTVECLVTTKMICRHPEF